MPAQTLSKPALCLTLALSVALPLQGCQSVERETGFNQSTQYGALGGAAFGGIVAALADANPAWIAASVILGGVAGGAIGNALGKKDAETHARTHYGAIDRLGEGERQSWHDSDTGNSGNTRVTRVVTHSDGRVCKSYVETVHTRSQTVTKEGTVCREPGGTWHGATT